jgi:hypothetical protein
MWGSHAKVTLAAAAIDIVWLFPFAWGACRYPEAAPAFAAVAIAPLVYLAFRFHGGLEEPSPQVVPQD